MPDLTAGRRGRALLRRFSVRFNNVTEERDAAVGAGRAREDRQVAAALRCDAQVHGS